MTYAYRLIKRRFILVKNNSPFKTSQDYHCNHTWPVPGSRSAESMEKEGDQKTGVGGVLERKNAGEPVSIFLNTSFLQLVKGKPVSCVKVANVKISECAEHLRYVLTLPCEAK